MTASYTLRKAFDFYRTAITRYQINSPFVADFIKEVLKNNRHYYAYGEVDKLTDRLERDSRVIEHHDLGAGSKYKFNKKTVKSFLQSSSSTAYKGKILFHLARKYHPNHILELGTNLGVGSCYLSLGNKSSTIDSLEGCPNLSKIAQENFHFLKLNNIKITIGNFKNTLDEVLESIPQLDLAFLDGDHSYAGTMEYFQKIKPIIYEKSIVILDDIYWSEGMTKAWNEIKADPSVRLSIDLFSIGILFFDTSVQMDELKLIPYRYKPWKMGFFH